MSKKTVSEKKYLTQHQPQQLTKQKVNKKQCKVDKKTWLEEQLEKAETAAAIGD